MKLENFYISTVLLIMYFSICIIFFLNALFIKYIYFCEFDTQRYHRF